MPTARSRNANPYTWYDLTAGDTPTNVRFSPRPQSLQLLATIEVVVKDPTGHYLAITCPRYEPIEAGSAGAADVERGQWTPPFIKHPIHAEALGSLAAIRQRIDAWLDESRRKKIRQEVGRVVQSWSCGLRNPQLRGEFLEVKPSWASPGTQKAYLIQRWFFETEDCDPAALADGEHHRGLRFLPIDDAMYEAATKKRKCRVHQDRHTLFLHRPLATNLRFITETPARRAALRDHAVELEPGDYHRRFEGVLFCGDIANYGAACAFAERHMGNFKEGGPEAATMLRESSMIAFSRLFLRAGTLHVHTAGDGFICGLPCSLKQRDITASIKSFLSAYKDLADEIDRDNDRMASLDLEAEPPQLGSRLAIHVGDYSYGKTGLAASLLPAFDGAAVVTVSRLEQALRNHIKQGSGPSGHRIALSADAAALCDVSKLNCLTNESAFQGASKEASLQGKLFTLSY